MLLQGLQMALPILFESSLPLFMPAPFNECHFPPLLKGNDSRCRLSEMLLTFLRSHKISDANKSRLS